MTQQELNQYNEEKISGTDISCRQRFMWFLFDAQKQEGPLMVPQAYRSIAYQNDLYAQGRTKPGNVVTNAKGGESFHNFGLAIDVCRGDGSYPAKEDPFWDRLALIAAKHGLEHGDRGAVDKPHFQYRAGLSLSQVQQGQRPALDDDYKDQLTFEEMTRLEMVEKRLNEYIQRTSALEVELDKVKENKIGEDKSREIAVEEMKSRLYETKRVTKEVAEKLGIPNNINVPKNKPERKIDEN